MYTHAAGRKTKRDPAGGLRPRRPGADLPALQAPGGD